MWPPKIKQGLGSIKRSIETRKGKVMSLLLPVLWAPHHILRGRSDNLGHVQRREARMVGRCKTLSHRDCSRMGLFVGAGGVLKGQRDMMFLLVLFFFNLKVSHVVLTCLCRSSRTNTEHKLQKVPQVQNGGAPAAVSSLPWWEWMVHWQWYGGGIWAVDETGFRWDGIQRQRGAVVTLGAQL